jgi:hypothetical protein
MLHFVSDNVQLSFAGVPHSGSLLLPPATSPSETLSPEHESEPAPFSRNLFAISSNFSQSGMLAIAFSLVM